MKKNLLVFGQKVHCKETGLEVVVSDLGLKGNEVGITCGRVAKIVDADVLEEIVTPITEVASEISVSVPEMEIAPIKAATHSTIPTIRKEYDEKTNSLYLIINEKTTICVSNVSPEIINAVGISYCNDTDRYNTEIGEALAFSRAFAATNAVNKENETQGLEDFLKFLEEEAAE